VLISASSADELFLRGVERLLINGDLVAPRGMMTRELMGVQLRMNDSTMNIVTVPERKLNYSFMCAEFLWMITGQNRIDLIEPYNSKIASFAAAAGDYTFQGAYGVKLLDQLPWAIECLREDATARQAVVNIWRERAKKTPDVPCTLSFQFMLRNDALDLIVTMRSNDVWLGTPYDVFNFTMLQQMVATELGVKRGRYIHTAGSFHLYERNQTDAARTLYAAQQREQSNSTPLEHIISGIFNPTHPRTTLPLPMKELSAVQAAFLELTITGTVDRLEYYKELSEGWLTLLRVVARRHERTYPLTNGWEGLCSRV
jgi:thymidylate synthase